NATATWQFGGLSAGTYDVQAYWPSIGGNAPDASYSLYEGPTLLATVQADQSRGSGFQTVATVSLHGAGPLQVVVHGSNKGFVVADAVKVATPVPPIDLNWSGGGVTVPATVDNRLPFTIDRTYTVTGADVARPLTIAYYAKPVGVAGGVILLGTETITDPFALTAGTHAGTSPPLMFASHSNTTPPLTLPPRRPRAREAGLD